MDVKKADLIMICAQRHLADYILVARPSQLHVVILRNAKLKPGKHIMIFFDKQGAERR